MNPHNPFNHYVITGLPRTRSSWLSVLFTWQNSFCYHELGNMADNVEELVQILRIPYQEYTGTADCVSSFYYEAMCEYLKEELPLVIIERDVGNVLGSLYKCFNTHFSKQIEKYILQLEYLMKYFNPLIVKFEDLDQIQTIGSIWRHCVKSNVDTNRLLQLDRLKIEPFLPKYVVNVNDTNADVLIQLPRKKEQHEKSKSNPDS